jgi:hypothetical protein
MAFPVKQGKLNIFLFLLFQFCVASIKDITYPLKIVKNGTNKTK